MRVISSPYLHELFKACLLYDAEDAMRKLRHHYPSWKLVSDWKLVTSHQEILLQKIRKWKEGKLLPSIPKQHKVGDVVWELSLEDRKGVTVRKSIVHEIKTGRFSINEIFEEYDWFRTRLGHIGGFSPLWVWGWKSILNAQQPNEGVERKIRYGFIRLIPLEIIFSIVKKRMEEIGFHFTEG